MKLLVLLCLCPLALAAVDHGSAGAPDAPPEFTRTTSPTRTGEQVGRRYCGREMAAVMYLLCSKNSEDNYLGTSQFGDAIDAGDRSAVDVRRRRSGTAGRARRSLVEECCYSECTLQDLLAYC